MLETVENMHKTMKIQLEKLNSKKKTRSIVSKLKNSQFSLYFLSKKNLGKLKRIKRNE